MGQNLRNREELDLMLLAMSGHDLKRAMRGVLAMLELFSEEANCGSLPPAEADRVAHCIVAMRQSGAGMTSSLDEMLAVLDRVSPMVGQLGVLVQCFESEDFALSGSGNLSEAHERWLDGLSDLPPHVWNM